MRPFLVSLLFIIPTQLLAQEPNTNSEETDSEETNSEEINDNAGMVITTRGTYGWIKNTLGSSYEDKMTNIIKLTSTKNFLCYQL